MGILDIDYNMSDEYFALGSAPKLAQDSFREIIQPLLRQLRLGEPIKSSTRLGFEVNKEYKILYTDSDGNSQYKATAIDISEWINVMLTNSGEDKLKDMISRIDCSKVMRMGIATDFVLTALQHKTPIVLIENITELPDSPRRDDIEDVLIHSWAKDKFVCIDDEYDTTPHIVIFTSRPKNEVGDAYFPVWNDKDNYDWHGNVMKDISNNGIIDIEILRVHQLRWIMQKH